MKNKTQLNQNYQDYYSDKDLRYKNFILEGPEDHTPYTSAIFRTTPNRESAPCKKHSTVRGYDYQKQKNTTTSHLQKMHWSFPPDQPKGKMAHILLEPNTKLNDSLTYDITAWSLSLRLWTQSQCNKGRTWKQSPSEAYSSQIPLIPFREGSIWVRASLSKFCRQSVIGSPPKKRFRECVTIPYPSPTVENAGKVGRLFILERG